MPTILTFSSIICIILIATDIGGIATFAIASANAIGAILTGYAAIRGIKKKKKDERKTS